MTNQEFYDALTGISGNLLETDTATAGKLDCYRRRLSWEISEESNRISAEFPAGFSKARRSAVERIARRISCGSRHLELSGGFIQRGRYCVSDGYRVLRLSVALDLPAAAGLDLSGAIHPWEFTAEVALPASKAVRQAMALDKNAWIAAGQSARNYRVSPWTFGRDLPAVNPQYLLDMVESLPGCKCYRNPDLCGNSALYFSAELGDGFLLPIRPGTSARFCNRESY